MADVVTSTIYDGARNVILTLGNISDATGQSGVTILDPATLLPNPGTHLVLWRVTYDVKGGGVNIEWGGTPNKSMIAMSGADTRDFSRFGGIRNDALTPTGLIRISTIGFAAGSTYSVILEFKKGGPVPPSLGFF